MHMKNLHLLFQTLKKYNFYKTFPFASGVGGGFALWYFHCMTLPYINLLKYSCFLLACPAHVCHSWPARLNHVHIPWLCGFDLAHT